MAMLEVEGLTKAFGGVVANNDISFSVEEGEILGLIGPNGAGKSTVFELLTGFHSADAGRVRFQGRPILGLRPDQINRLGMGRTFQKLKPFQRMTVEENVMVGGLQHDADLGAAREQALTALYFVGLLDKRNADARTLSTGQRKRLELARAMATGPKLLLLDEPTAGMARADTNNTIDLLKHIKATRDITMAIIEHDMHVVFSLAERITVLAQGTPLVEDTPENIKGHPKVQEAYLGTTAED